MEKSRKGQGCGAGDVQGFVEVESKEDENELLEPQRVKHFSSKFFSSLVAQLVKNLPAMRETWVQPPGWEDPLEKATATQPSILAWRIPWTV